MIYATAVRMHARCQPLFAFEHAVRYATYFLCAFIIQNYRRHCQVQCSAAIEYDSFDPQQKASVAVVEHR